VSQNLASILKKLLTIALALAFLLVDAPASNAYSVLAHEALIDAAWNDTIRPILLQRFPNATPEELKHAHAHAYGGAIIQDLGYYPHGSHFFSDLTHYVRSGDFILALLRDAQDLNGYAFALGKDCNFCHVQGNFAADDKPEKATARKMMEMAMAINKNHFNDRPQVRCFTCHQGNAHPPGPQF